MKRLGVVLLLLSCTFQSAICEERSEVIKVYDWPELMSEEAIAGFPEYYKKYTGKDIRVQYQTFESDVTALNNIVASHDDWDVITLSNFYLQKYVRDGTLLPIDSSYLEKYGAPDNLDNTSPYLAGKLNECCAEFRLSDYYIPFSLNSCGIAFDSGKYSRSDFSSWNVLRDPGFSGKILFVSDPTDLYYVALADIYHEDIQSGKLTLHDIYSEMNDKYLDEIRKWSIEAGPRISGWDTGFGYDYMVHGKVSVKVCWLSDASYLIDLSREEGGPDIDFVFPDEGSYLCFDGHVIPKYCGNPEAAVFWINYLHESEVIISNLSLGLSSMVDADTVVLKAIQDKEKYPDPIDLSYLFPDCPDKASKVYLSDAKYIDASAIDRFSFTADVSDNLDDLLMLLTQVQAQKTRLAEFWPEAIIFIVLLALLVAGLLKKK